MMAAPTGRSTGGDRRVVVTGTQLVTPLGRTTEETFAALVDGRCAIAPITRFDARGLSCQIAAAVDEDVLSAESVGAGLAATLDGLPLGAQLGAVAGVEAVRRAGLGVGLDTGRASEFGVCMGTSGRMYEIDYLDRLQRFLNESGTWSTELFDRDPDPDALLAHEHHTNRRDVVTAVLTELVGTTGVGMTVSATCASGTQAIGEAYWAVLEGDTDVMIAGGCDSLLSFTGIASFDLLSALATKFNDEPVRASRPFDRRRNGFVMGEGGAAVVLEELSHALARGAEPLAEVIGYASSCDAYRITDSPPDGRGARLAMAGALDSARILPHEVDYVSAHGTSTLVNDRAETRAMRAVFGAAADAVPMSSQKSMLGHSIGAAGAIEFVTCVEALRQGVLPPTINYEEADPECDLDYVPNVAREASGRVAMSNSFGFGGQNASIVVRRFGDAIGTTS